MKQIAEALETSLLEMLAVGEEQIYSFHNNQQNGTYGGLVVNWNNDLATTKAQIEVEKDKLLLAFENEKLKLELSFLQKENLYLNEIAALKIKLDKESF